VLAGGRACRYGTRLVLHAVPCSPEREALAIRSFYSNYELCDDLDRISEETIAGWLHDDAYWSKERSREMIERSIDHSFLYGVLHVEGGTVGCASGYRPGDVRMDL
jgi:hypothetical protein